MQLYLSLNSMARFLGTDPCMSYSSNLADLERSICITPLSLVGWGAEGLPACSWWRGGRCCASRTARRRRWRRAATAPACAPASTSACRHNAEYIVSAPALQEHQSTRALAYLLQVSSATRIPRDACASVRELPAFRQRQARISA